MKKVLLSLTMMLMVAFSGFAEEITITTNSSASPTISADKKVVSFTSSGVTVSYSQGDAGQTPRTPDTDHIRVYQKNVFSVKAPAGKVLKSVVINCLSASYAEPMDVLAGGGEVKVNKAESKAQSTLSWTGSIAEFKATPKSKQVRSVSVVVTLGDAPSVSTPTLTPTPGTYYNPVEVGATCTTEGVTLHYTTDGTVPTATSAQLTGKVKIEKTTTFKVIAVKGTESSSVASGEYVIKSIVKVASVADFLKTAKGEKVEFTCPLTVTYQNGWSMFVQDAAQDPLQIFGDVVKTYKNGDVIVAGVQGLVGEHNSHLQLSSPEKETFAEATAGIPVQPIEITAATLNVKDHFNRLVVVKNATLTSNTSNGKVYFTVTDSEGASVNNYNNFKLEAPADLTKKYDVIGIGSEHSNKAQIFLVAFEEVSSTGIKDVETGVHVSADVFSIVIKTTEPTDILVYDVVGKVVDEATVSGEYVFSVNPGVYLVRTSNKVFKVLVK